MTSSLEQITFVTDIPFITDDTDELKDKLEVYFGQRKHGGGEVEKIVCPVAGKVSQAFVVFESAKGKCTHNQSTVIPEVLVSAFVLLLLFYFVFVSYVF